MNNVIYERGYSIKGKRKDNQDRFIILRNHYGAFISMVADGMGGHEGGQVAASFVVKSLKKEFRDVNFFALKQQEIEKKLLGSIRILQHKLVEFGEKNLEFANMGTTLNLVLILKNKMYTLNIGDSRTTILFQNHLQQITEDHNLEQYLKDNPGFEDLKNKSKYLISSLGPNKETRVDLFKINLPESCFIIQTTDGVHNHISNDYLKDVVFSKQNLNKKIFDLMKKAYDNESTDNMTIVLIKYERWN